MSRRRNIINTIVNKLREIDGGVSPFDASYTFANDIAGNAYRYLKFIDEVNDFPSLYLEVLPENRIYQTKGATESSLPFIIRIYVNQENSSAALESVMQDVEHIIYNLESQLSDGVRDVTISSTSTDEGIFDPLGIGEIELLVNYELAD